MPVGDDQPLAFGKDPGIELGRLGEEELVGKFPVFRPFAVDLEVDEAGLDLDGKPQIMAGLTKHGKHEALADIQESIEELKYYREHFLKL